MALAVYNLHPKSLTARHRRSTPPPICELPYDTTHGSFGACTMFGLLSRHSFTAIWLAVLIEEIGIPMPIPSDLLIVFAGAAIEEASA